ncbi:allatostatin-A receptor [Biomphalaria glabrata]|nr:allatostatin-A receptor [Biomphalaria glabrata]
MNKTSIQFPDILSLHDIPISAVSNDQLSIFLVIVRVIVTQGLCILGVVTNVLCIVTFVAQGLRDTVNTGLLALAVSDLLSLVTLSWLSVLHTPDFSSRDLPFIPLEMGYLTAGWPHVFFTRITTWITVYITLERCFCIAAPMKVKAVFTPRRTVMYIVGVYLVMLASVFPIYYTARFANKFVPQKNITLLGIVFISDRNDIETVSFHINNILPLTAFILIIVGTAILTRKLLQISIWRLKTSSVNRSEEMLSRDTKIVKMIVSLSTIFILCYLPGTIVFIWMMLDPELRIDGQHSYLFEAAFATLFLLEALNSSVSIFVYLATSTKFRQTFFKMFFKPIKSQQDPTASNVSVKQTSTQSESERLTPERTIF